MKAMNYSTLITVVSIGLALLGIVITYSRSKTKQFTFLGTDGVAYLSFGDNVHEALVNLQNSMGLASVCKYYEGDVSSYARFDKASRTWSVEG